MESSKLKSITYVWILVFVFIVIMLWILPSIALTYGRGFENTDYWQSYATYVGWGAMFLFLVGVLNTFRFLLPETSSLGWFRGFINNPEENALFGKSIILKNPVLHTLLWLIIFSSLIGYFTFYKQIVFGSLPVIQQQITAGANFILSIEPAVTSETFGFLLLAMFVMGIGGNWLKKQWGWQYQLLFSTFAGFVGSVLGIALHSWRYASDPIAIQYVAIFWFILVFLSAFFFSIIPALVLHYVNNIVLALQQLFGDLSSSIVLVWIISLIVIFILYYISVRGKKK